MKKEKKLIELGIISENPLAGIEMIALVESPAIETDFMYFAAECPEATQDIKTNLENRQKAIDVAHYGPLNPNLPNEAYWKAKAKMFNDSVEDAKTALCENCSFFITSQAMKDCIAKGIGTEGGDPLDVIDAGDLGYCEAFDFKCASARTCDAWVATEKEEFIKPNPCWPGYEAIGTKEKDGREVPNCVPIKNSKADPEKYMFVEPNAGEKKVEFISRCMSVVTDEGYEQDQAIAICYSYWDEKMEIDTAGLPGYVDETGKKPAAKAKDLDAPDPDWEYSAFEAEVLERALTCGIPVEMASEATIDEANAIRAMIDTDTSKLQLGEYEIRYRYSKNPTMDGGRAERGFCKAMLYMSRYYTRAEIDSMSGNGVNSQFAEKGTNSYDIFQFRGGCYCKHSWKAYLYYKPYDGSKQIVMEAPSMDGPVQPVPRLNFQSQFKFQDEEKRIVVGPTMIPDMEIPRIDEETKERYFVKFSKETVLETMKKFMKEARNRETNQDHEASKSAGTYVYESWIVEDPEKDKANLIYGFNVPAGTWMTSMQVEDPAVWKRVKSGELRGFSIEGNFADMEEIAAAKKYLKIMKILKD
jgi:hypothetical protein